MKPTTPPVRNAICIAFSRPPSSRAAAATRRLARVASAMPSATDDRREHGADDEEDRPADLDQRLVVTRVRNRQQE